MVIAVLGWFWVRICGSREFLWWRQAVPGGSGKVFSGSWWLYVNSSAKSL